MNWLRRMMYGRNGPDQLSLAVLIFGLALTIAAQFIPVPVVRGALQLVDYLCLVYFFFRVISRNVSKRREENLRFLRLLSSVKGWFVLRGRMIRDLPGYKYFKCPRCSQRIRAPRKKGKILISCQKCGEQFEKKT